MWPMVAVAGAVPHNLRSANFYKPQMSTRRTVRLSQRDYVPLYLPTGRIFGTCQCRRGSDDHRT